MTDLFIISRVDLEHTKENTLKFVSERYCISVYILKVTEIKNKM